jgi:adenylylsulfate kinase
MTTAPDRADRAGATVWLTGLPSAGKSTIAVGVAERLRAGGRRVEILDGDEVRANLSRDLGFTKEDRIENVRRIGRIAQLLARNGIVVLVPVIAPYAEARERVRNLHDRNGTRYFEVYVATPVEVCAVRDLKGLYARQARGEIAGLTGVDDPYDVPVAPDLQLEAHQEPIDSSVAATADFLAAQGFGV